jgi:hypothetical protein
MRNRKQLSYGSYDEVGLPWWNIQGPKDLSGELHGETSIFLADNIVSATALLLEVDIQHGQFESISNCFLEHRCSAFFPSKTSNHLRYDNYVKKC